MAEEQGNDQTNDAIDSSEMSEDQKAMMDYLDEQMSGDSDEIKADAEREQESLEDVSRETDSDGTPDSDGQPDSDGTPDADAEKTPEEAADDDLAKEITNERTKQRFEEFRQIAREANEQKEELESLRQEHEQVKGYWEGISTVLRETGGSEQEITDALMYVRHIKSGNFQAAEQMLMRQLNQFQVATGRQLNAPDPLDQFPQLKARVENMEMTRETALQLAQSERQQAIMRDHAQNQMQANQQNQVVMQGRDQMAQMEQQIIAGDPRFSEKAEYIKQQMNADVRVYPPGQWAQRYQFHHTMATQQLQQLDAAKAQAQRKEPEPMRSMPAGGGVKQPNSLMDAIENGLAEANA